VCAIYAPKDLLDSFVNSHQNGGRLGGEIATGAGTTTARDHRLVRLSLNLLVAGLLQNAGLTEKLSV
jgi:hypothetical protein